MRQAISTKYLGPTDHRGSRVSARCQACSLTVAWDDALDVTENHTAAAKALATKLQWVGRWIGGALPDGRGNCYIQATGANHHDFVVTDVTP